MRAWGQTELSARAQREVERAREQEPHSLGRIFPDTPGTPSPDDEGGPLPQPLEEWAQNWGLSGGQTPLAR